MVVTQNLEYELGNVQQLPTCYWFQERLKLGTKRDQENSLVKTEPQMDILSYWRCKDYRTTTKERDMCGE